MSEAPHSEMSTLVADLALAFHQLADKPYVLFGHSLGGLVAYEFVQRCGQFGLPQPQLLIASACRAPHLPSKRPSIHALPQAEFIDKLRELNGTPEELLSNAELIQFLIPLLRADFKIADLYRAEPSRLQCPVTVLAGMQDWDIPEASVEGWRELASGPCEIHWIPGGHFFVEHERKLVLEKINTAISQINGTATGEKQNAQIERACRVLNAS